MLFSSFTFLCFFLPIVLAVYYLMPAFLKNIVLLIASLFFYAWGEPHYVICMLAVVGIVYISAMSFSLYDRKITRQLLLICSIVCLVGFLFFFKYSDFFVLNMNHFFKLDMKLLNIVMPIGISFYIFQALSYLIDVYLGKVQPQKDFFKLALYVSLFPQLIAGPIVRYQTVCRQLSKRYHSFWSVYRGFERFIIGLGKKVIIANTLGVTVDRIFEMPTESLSPSVAWLGMIFYTLQLYFDFSGYSDMAIGLGRMFGFKFLENFNYPYRSRSITEFWRRWHISLSGWFKEYVYFPLGGSQKGIIRTVINLGIVFLLTGLWHGAAWTFIVWGAWHGFFIILEKCVFSKLVFLKKFFPIMAQRGIKKYLLSLSRVLFCFIVPHAYALFVVMIGWVLFRSESFLYAKQYIQLLFGMGSYHPNFNLLYYTQKSGFIMAFLGIVLSMGAGRWILFVRSWNGQILRDIWLWIVLFMSVVLLMVATYNPFIYFRF